MEKLGEMTVKELKELLEKFDENFHVVVGGGIDLEGFRYGDLCIYNNKRVYIDTLMETTDESYNYNNLF